MFCENKETQIHLFHKEVGIIPKGGKINLRHLFWWYILGVRVDINDQNVMTDK